MTASDVDPAQAAQSSPDFSLELRAGYREMIFPHQVFPDALDDFVERLGASVPNTGAIEFWCFSNVERRRRAERTLQAAGFSVRVRSAYKPLMHFMIEEIPLAEVTRAVVHYPVDARAASSNRFLSEAYPLAAMLTSKIDFVPKAASDLTYHVEVEFADGRREQHAVFAPNRVQVDAFGEKVFIPCGWHRTAGTSPSIDAPVRTEYELLFEAAMHGLRRHSWSGPLPFFERMEIRAEIAGFETHVTEAPGQISTFDALHEDLYFSAQEFFIQLCGRKTGDRTVRSGQVVPLVRPRSSGASLTIEAVPYPLPAALEVPASIDLERAQVPIDASQLAEELKKVPGVVVEGRSVQGRPVVGIHRETSAPGILITGGQHANEPTGIVGAIRAARRLALLPDAHFGLVALENPDGYALREELAQLFPHHLLHAARYTALGDDIPSRQAEPLFEKAVRLDMARRTKAVIHCTLHGYPAHEWTRPSAGYVTKAMEEWSVPRGFFLILRPKPGWEKFAQALAEHVARQLSQLPELAAFNARSLDIFRTHTGLTPETLHGIPLTYMSGEGGLCPVTLTTEFPDETIHGAPFELGHTTQMQAVLSAHEFLISPAGQALMPSAGEPRA